MGDFLIEITPDLIDYHILVVFFNILSEFNVIYHDEYLPNGLPHMWDNKYVIDFRLRSQLLNLHHYQMNLTKHAEHQMKDNERLRNCLLISRKLRSLYNSNIIGPKERCYLENVYRLWSK